LEIKITFPGFLSWLDRQP